MSYPNKPPAPAGPGLPREMSAEELYKLARNQPRAWLAIAAHPNAYPDLLSWLDRVGPPEVKEVVARRKGGGGPAQAAPAQRSAPPAGAPGAPGVAPGAGRPGTGIPAVGQAPAGGVVGRPQSGPRPGAMPARGAQGGPAGMGQAPGPLPQRGQQQAGAGPAPGMARPAPGMPQPGGAQPVAPKVQGMPQSAPVMPRPAPAQPAGSGFAPAAGPTPGMVGPAPGMPQPGGAQPASVQPGQPAPMVSRATPSPSPQSGASDSSDDVNQLPAEHTVLAKRTKRTKPLATLSWDGGEPVRVTKEQVIVGRRVPRVLRSDQSQIIEVNDPTKTVSAKHARLSRINGKWFIEDLESTNGIYLVAEDGSELELQKQTEVTEKFYLGDVAFKWEQHG